MAAIDPAQAYLASLGRWPVANKNVSADTYPDPTMQEIAKTYFGDSGTTLAVGPNLLSSAATQTADYKGVITYLQHPGPARRCPEDDPGHGQVVVRRVTHLHSHPGTEPMSTFLDNVPLLIIVGAIGHTCLGLPLPRARGAHRRAAADPGGRWLRPWVWLLVPFVMVVLILLYPVVSTIVSAFRDAQGSGYVGFANFVWAFQGTMVDVIKNNLLWLFVFPLGTLVLALAAAVLFDRVKYERVAMTLIIMPTAISFVAGAVIWTQMYSYQPKGSPQIGTFNALITLGTRGETGAMVPNCRDQQLCPDLHRRLALARRRRP